MNESSYDYPRNLELKVKIIASKIYNFSVIYFD